MEAGSFIKGSFANWTAVQNNVPLISLKKDNDELTL